MNEIFEPDLDRSPITLTGNPFNSLPVRTCRLCGCVINVDYLEQHLADQHGVRVARNGSHVDDVHGEGGHG